MGDYDQTFVDSYGNRSAIVLFIAVEFYRQWRPFYFLSTGSNVSRRSTSASIDCRDGNIVCLSWYLTPHLYCAKYHMLFFVSRHNLLFPYRTNFLRPALKSHRGSNHGVSDHYWITWSIADCNRSSASVRI